MDKFISDPSSDDDPSDEVRVPLFRDEIRVGAFEIGGLGDWCPPSFRTVEVEDEKDDRKSSHNETDFERLFFKSWLKQKKELLLLRPAKMIKLLACYSQFKKIIFC